MSKLPNLRRIRIVLNFYRERGINSERVNTLYRTIINTPKNERNCK